MLKKAEPIVPQFHLPLRLAMFVSGGGTTAQAIVRACKRGGELFGLVKPVLAIASKHGINAIPRMKTEGMEPENIVVIRSMDFENQDAFGRALLAECAMQRVDVIGQYGWLKKTPANVIAKYPCAMINQHPGPLDPGFPDFGGQGMYGLRVHEARILFAQQTGRDFWTEATAQFVTEEFDRGALVNTCVVEINPDDTPELLAERVLAHEHAIQIAALRDFATREVIDIPRKDRLIRRGEEELLAQVKTQAIRMYPHG
ncbi:MAG: hypothetical protein ACD_76C00130G0003 [uncultured bacterium]|nr:MAG: hypothetical protein ACD_76C00130G0003 [uncultured bacterium]